MKDYKIKKWSPEYRLNLTTDSKGIRKCKEVDGEVTESFYPAWKLWGSILGASVILGLLAFLLVSYFFLDFP